MEHVSDAIESLRTQLAAEKARADAAEKRLAAAMIVPTGTCLRMAIPHTLSDHVQVYRHACDWTAHED